MATRTEQILWTVGTSFAQGEGDCTFVTPSVSNAFAQIRSTLVIFLRPFIYVLRDAFHGQINRGAAIIGLFFVCSPFYIANFVMTVIINPIQAMLWRRTSTNFMKEFLIRREMKFNATFAISRIVLMLFICATVFGTAICSIFRRIGFAVGMSASFRGHRIYAITSAPKDNELSQGRADAGDSITTVAQTMPHCLISVIQTGKANDEQAVESFTCQIFNACRRFSRIVTNGKVVGRHIVQSSFLNNLASRVDWSLKSFRPAFILSHGEVFI